jgi:hypothetical protein
VPSLICRWILSAATVVVAGATAYAGVIVHVVGAIQGSTQQDEFWLLAELAAMGAGPLVLGAFLVVALWVRGRAITIAALVAAGLCLGAALVIAARESFVEMAPVLLYVTALVTYFGTAVRNARQHPSERR